MHACMHVCMYMHVCVCKYVCMYVSDSEFAFHHLFLNVPQRKAFRHHKLVSGFLVTAMYSCVHPGSGCLTHCWECRRSALSIVTINLPDTAVVSVRYTDCRWSVTGHSTNCPLLLVGLMSQQP